LDLTFSVFADGPKLPCYLLLIPRQRLVSGQDLVDFAWFLAKKRGLEVRLHPGETFEALQGRIVQAGKEILNFPVIVKAEPGGKFFVWRV
jgi:hypothetical protein